MGLKGNDNEVVWCWLPVWLNDDVDDEINHKNKSENLNDTLTFCSNKNKKKF